VQISAYLRPDQIRSLQALSERKDEPVAALVRRAVDRLLMDPDR